MALLSVKQPGAEIIAFGFSRDQVDLIKEQIAKDATDNELKLFLYQCQRTALDPLAKQIYFRKQWNKKRGCNDIIFITAIDGYRLIADRTGKYAGNDDPVFDNEDNPQKATCTVYKMVDGQVRPFTASARWSQFYPGDQQGFMWQKMPHHMLGKCAEALALRKAFPNELSGIYTKEEMDQADFVAETIELPQEASTTPPPALTPTKVTADEIRKQLTAKIHAACEEHGLPSEAWPKVEAAMRGKTLKDLPDVIERIQIESLIPF